MASVYGVQYTKAFVNSPSDKVDVSRWGGRVRCMSDSFTLTADLASGDKIYLGRLPKGAIIHEVILASDDLDASGGTLDVGYEYPNSEAVADPDAFLANVDVATAADTVSMSDQANMVGFLYETLGLADIIITTDGDTDATSGTIRLDVLYSVD